MAAPEPPADAPAPAADSAPPAAPATAPAPAKAKAKGGYKIAPGKSLTSPRGVLGPGDACSEKDFGEFAGLIEKGYIVES